MKLDIAVREKDNLRAAIRLLKFFIIVIGLAVVYQSYKVGKAIEYQKTILVPFGLDTQLEVSGDDLTDESADYYARRVTSLRATYSPGTTRKNFNLLLRLYAPEAYPDAWKVYYDFADRIETTNVSSVFYQDKIEVDRKNRQIVAEGFSRKYKDNTPLGESGVRFIISYKVDRGMFQLLKIEEKEKK